MRRPLRVLLAALATGATVVLSAPAALADDGTISHVERTDDGFNVLVDVPAGADVDLDAVTATVAGQPADASAQLASTADVRRVEVLAIDVSDSMAGARFDAAKQAAEAFLDAAPDNVEVGIVTFSSTVTEALQPTTDRDAARGVVEALTLSKGTQLYDGVVSAMAMAGDEGLRSVLVISDGANTGPTPIGRAISARQRTGVLVDVVALDQTEANLAKLRRIAGDGQVVDGDAASLEAAFEAQAQALQRQVDVVVTAPAGASVGQPTLAITLPTSTGDIVAQATVPGDATDSAAPAGITVQTEQPEETRDFPKWVKYAGVVVFGVGLLLAALMLVPRKPVAMTPAERITTYTTGPSGPGGHGGHPEEEHASEDPLATAKEAMANVLRRNRDLDERITARLDAAGNPLKASEWLLLHAGIFIGAGLLGLLIGRGNLLVGLIFLAIGGFGPWIYLGLQRSRRRKAFNAGLPDTLQLMSGSLSAGLSLAQSVDTIVREGPEPVASEFKRVLVETRLGVPLEDAFDGVASRFDSRDFAWVVMAIRIQRQVGGNLAELLDTVAATMREREYMRRQVAALAAEGKLSAIVLAAVPPGFLLYLMVANREYVMPLFTDPRGWVMLVVGATILSVGIFWMSRLVRVEV